MASASTVASRRSSFAPSRWTSPGPVSAIVAGAVVVVWLLVLWLTGSPVGDVAAWFAAVLVGVLAPGFVVVRVSRRAVAPLIEDLSWAAAAGCIVALLGWFLDRVLPVSPGPFIFGPLVVVLGLAFPGARRRVFARPAAGWGAGPSLALGAIVLVSIAWMMATGLLAYRVDPGAQGTLYYPDIMYQLDLVGELRHAVVPTYPPVAGTSLSYHWFLYAITSHLLTHTGVGVFDSTLRLGPATLVPAILMLTAVVARRLSGQVWAGPLAAALLGVVSISEASRWSPEDGSLGTLPRIWRASPPQTMGWLASMAAAGTLFAFLRRAPGDRAVPVALLIPFLILTAGSKSSELPVLIAGVALAAVAQALRRDWLPMRRCVVAFVGMLAVFELASLTIYGGSSYGVREQLFGVARARVNAMFPHVETRTTASSLVGVHVPLLALGTVSALFLLPLLPRLLGLFFQVRYRPEDSVGWVCLGTAAAGLGLPFVLRHPAGSEVYFMLSAYPIGVVGAAGGLLLAIGRVRQFLPSAARARRFGWWLAALLAVGAVSAAIVANVQPHLDPGTRAARAAVSPGQGRLAWMWWTPTLTLLAVLGLLTLIAVPVIRRSWPARRAPLVWLSAMSLLLGTGLFATTLYFRGTDTPVAGSVAYVHPQIRPGAPRTLLPTLRDAFTAGRYVDEHAKTDDVVVTNMYCRYTRVARVQGGAACDARNFAASALTQRHTLVGGWAYADRIVASAWTLKMAYSNAPFWNQKLLSQQYDAFAHPTSALLGELYRRHHVRWIFVDLRDAPVNVTALDQLAQRRFLGPTTGVWQLRTPGSTSGR